MPDQSSPSPLPPGTPSHQQQQWGVIISIVIIVLMIVTGAFYAWGQRISEQNALDASANNTDVTDTYSTTTAE